MSLNHRTWPENSEKAIKKSARLPFLITTTIAFLAYIFTLEPDLTWANFGGDGGELITAAVTLGIPHPPGYPTYVLIGNLFGRLPIGTVTFRFNLLSAVATAVSAGFVTAIVFHIRPTNARIRKAGTGKAGLFRGIVVAVAAGLTFAFGSLVWGQAVIAEVYGLNLAFVAGFLYVLLTVNQGDHKGRPYIVAGLLLGLSITTHLTSVFLLPLALITVPRQGWTRLVGGILVGLLPFLTLPLLAQSASPVIWGQPTTLADWWWLVSAQLYRPNVFGLDWADWPERLGQWSGPFLAQLAYVGLPLIALGIIGRFKRNGRLLIGLFGTALVYIFYAFTYHTTDAAVLLLPALLLLSIVLGFGLDYLGRWAIILPFALLWLNLSQSDNGYYVNQVSVVRPAAEALFNEVPADAILMTSGDPTIAALWYFHHIEGKRSDITVIDGNLFQFDWYRKKLGRDYPYLQHLAQDDLPGFIAENRRLRPFCETSLVPPGYLQC